MRGSSSAICTRRFIAGPNAKSLPDGLRVPIAVGPVLAQLEQPLGLIVHEDDVRLVIGDENRVGGVLEDDVQAIALAACFVLGETDALDLLLELVSGAAQIGDVAEYGEIRALLLHLAA
jgi:hypothetical protein